MNKRIKKKLNKRLNYKTHSHYHRELLRLVMAKLAPTEDMCKVVMSKNGKHVVKVEILTDTSQF